MSTKTNFKRIALVAVASLGLGVLSSVPSQAVGESWAITGSAGTATTSLSDSTTAGTFSVSFLQRAAEDSVVVSIKLKSDPGSGTAYPVLQFSDTSLARVDSDVTSLNWIGQTPNAQAESITAITGTKWFVRAFDTTTLNQRVSASFKVYLNGTVAAGAYVATVTVGTDERDAAGAAVFKTQDVTITVAAANKASAIGSSYAYMVTGATGASAASGTFTPVDSSVAAVATASATARGVIRVVLGNSTSTASESVTVTTTVGSVGTSTSKGRSVVMVYSGSYIDVGIYSDGTAGTATITVSTPSITFPTKSVTFYSATAAKITAASYASVIGASGVGVWGQEFDSLNNSFGAGIDVYAYSSDTSVISSYGSECTYNSTLKVALCTLTGVKDGTANITLRDASTVALSTVASNAVPVRVSLVQAASAKITFSKAAYAPGEKGTILVTVYDSAGKVMPAGTYTNLFATNGILTTAGVTAVSGDLTSVSVTTAANPVASATLPVVSADPVAQYVYYMPVAGGTVTLTATGGSSLPVAGQVAITATGTVTDSGAAALAAVTALATTVASLKTLITTLTNLVLKIQKKVKA